MAESITACKGQTGAFRVVEDGAESNPEVKACGGLLWLRESQLREACAKIHRLQDLRTYLAFCDAEHRHRQNRARAKRSKKPIPRTDRAFKVDALTEAAGLTRWRTRESLLRLGKLGLINWSGTMGQTLRPKGRSRKVFIPRKHLKELIQTKRGSRSKLEVFAWLCLRCLRLKPTGPGCWEVQVTGRCPYEAFWGSPRLVRRGMASLRALGVCKRLGSSGKTIRQRGHLFRVNLDWSGESASNLTNSVTDPQGKSPKPPVTDPVPTEPAEAPQKVTNSVTESHQFGHSHPNLTLSSQKTEKRGIPTGDPVKYADSQSQAVAKKKTPPVPNIEPADLEPGGLKPLRKEIVRRGTLTSSEADAQTFYSLVENASRRADDPGAMVAAALMGRTDRETGKPLLEMITDEDDDAGRRLKLQEEYGQKPHTAGTPLPELSEDARAVLLVKKLLVGNNLRGEPWGLLAKYGWTKSRWLAAEREFRQYRRQRARAKQGDTFSSLEEEVCRHAPPLAGREDVVAESAQPDGAETKKSV